VRCQQLFVKASEAAARSAIVSFGSSSVASLTESARPAYQPSKHLVVRERIIVDRNEVSPKLPSEIFSPKMGQGRQDFPASRDVFAVGTPGLL
jgi:hypothetical protein